MAGKAKRKPAARRRATQKTQVQTDRQRSGSDDGQDEKNEQSESIEGTEEAKVPTQEEFKRQEHEARVAHNERTGGGSVQEGELQAQREEHNRRTGDVSR